MQDDTIQMAEDNYKKANDLVVFLYAKAQTNPEEYADLHIEACKERDTAWEQLMTLLAV